MTGGGETGNQRGQADLAVSLHLLGWLTHSLVSLKAFFSLPVPSAFGWNRTKCVQRNQLLFFPGNLWYHSRVFCFVQSEKNISARRASKKLHFLLW